MVILGIDPGTNRIGYGIVKKQSGGLRFVSAGILKVKSGGSTALLEIKNGVAGLVRKFKPEVLAVEKLFFSKNRKTAMGVAEARGVIILAALEVGLKVIEYSPNEVKAGVAGYGFADKRAVLKMVRLTLNEPGLKMIDDASDALALAILGASNIHT
jgi:crossover junction endodeoxyribonuclease RuvC